MRLSAVPLVAACIAACAPAAAAGDAAPVSRYTTLRDCRPVETVPDEGGYARSACPGLGGYGLERVEADGRDNLLVVTPQGRKESLRLPSRSAGGFSSLGDTVEWRGTLAGGGFRPQALILRHAVVEDALHPERRTSYLWAVSLAGVPCPVGRIPPGEGQNEKAREMADGGEAGCL